MAGQSDSGLGLEELKGAAGLNGKRKERHFKSGKVKTAETKKEHMSSLEKIQVVHLRSSDLSYRHCPEISLIKIIKHNIDNHTTK